MNSSCLEDLERAFFSCCLLRVCVPVFIAIFDLLFDSDAPLPRQSCEKRIKGTICVTVPPFPFSFCHADFASCVRALFPLLAAAFSSPHRYLLGKKGEGGGAGAATLSCVVLRTRSSVTQQANHRRGLANRVQTVPVTASPS